jgi:tripartite-type tricarboxylate transporter receptor subunit TctC
MIDAGKARALAAMATERNPQFPDVPTLKEALGIDFSLGSWRGIAGPKGLPQPIVDKLAAALKKVNESKEFRDFMNARGFALVWADGPGFTKFLAENDAMMGRLLKAAGLAKA